MGHVTVSLNGRSYRLGCGDGEEPRLLELAAHVAERLDKLAVAVGQYGDERLLVMVALMLADELDEVRSAQSADRNAADAEASKDLPRGDADAPSAKKRQTDGIGGLSAGAAPETPAPDARHPDPGGEPGPLLVTSAPSSDEVAAPQRRPAPARTSLEARLAEARGERPPPPDKTAPDAA